MPPSFPLPLNLFAKQPPRIVQKTIQVNGQPFHFFHPAGDDTSMGTLSCLSQNKFHLNEIDWRAGDVFLDIGSNVGLVSLVVAKLVPGVRVLAFDASPLAIDCLRRSAVANDLTNIESYKVAVSGEEKKDLRFYSNGKDSSCLVAEGLNSSNKVPENTINQIRIDEIFDSLVFGVEQVKFFKLDAEGAEHSLFKYLFESRPDILARISCLHLEIHDYQEYDPKGLEAKVRAQWGDKVFFDV